MISIAQEAKQLSLLFDFGVIKAGEVISWADSMIVKMVPPPDALLELCTTRPDKVASITSLLHKLADGADVWSAFRAVIPKIRQHLIAQPESAGNIASHMDRMAIDCLYSGIPDDLNFISHFDDAFALAKEGIYQKPEIVYQDLLEQLEKFE